MTDGLYLPIAQHGLIGDLRSCALVGTDGTSDWFWLEEARLALEKMFTYADHLGLYAEQVGLAGQRLGNFPQAFTHISLISAALNLARELG